MLKTKQVEVKTTETQIEDATCDWCGKPFDKKSIEKEFQPYGEVEVRFGYGSRYDEDKWIGETCDDCFEKHLKPKMRKSENSE